MHMARKLGFRPLALTLVVLLCGCQRPATLNPVTGKVSYRGATLQNGLVVFTPDSSRGESGRIALGTIRADGTFALATDDAAGAPSGFYRVTVASFAAPGGNPTAVSLLPEKYRDPQLSLLTCEVKANRANTIDFNLD
jgi:hypothetical protein